MDFDTRRFYDRDTLANPFPLMARMRSEQPVARTADPAGREIFIVTEYALIDQIAKRIDDFSNDFIHLFVAGNAYPEVAAVLDRESMRVNMLLSSDEPAHKRYRALVNAVFATGRVARLAPTIEALADELIDDFIEDGECNFVNRFAVLLPTYIIADILGLPRDKYDKVKQWSDSILTIVGRMGSKEDEVRAAHGVVEFRRYLRETIVARRKEPHDDLLSNLVAARVDGVAPLTDEEAGALAFEISVAGNETTRNTLMSGLVQLLNHPDQMQALIHDDSLIDNAVEEILRYETPASSMWRIARRDMVLGGTAIPAGATLLLRYDGANRDPAKFSNPDRFDIRRPNARRHMAFGATGIHNCLGQMLARKELAVALRRLLGRLKNIRVAAGSDIAYQPSLMFHCIGGLHLAFDPGPRMARA